MKLFACRSRCRAWVWESNNAVDGAYRVLLSWLVTFRSAIPQDLTLVGNWPGLVENVGSGANGLDQKAAGNLHVQESENARAVPLAVPS
jgi:hypothetical protein